MNYPTIFKNLLKIQPSTNEEIVKELKEQPPLKKEENTTE